MTDMKPTLTEFLLARIAEDEAVARDALVADIATVAHEHMARWNPARVLAECEAKRAIVARHSPYDDIQVRRQTRTLAGDTLRLLALPYADHPAYDPAWEA